MAAFHQSPNDFLLQNVFVVESTDFRAGPGFRHGRNFVDHQTTWGVQADQYRGADCVLGWSFYSQGSKERTTAADEFLDWALAKLGVKLNTTSVSAEGEAIAEALMTRRALIVLDGVEPLRHGPGPQAGQLKDQGLRALLRRFAAAPPRD